MRKQIMLNAGLWPFNIYMLDMTFESFGEPQNVAKREKSMRPKEKCTRELIMLRM